MFFNKVFTLNEIRENRESRKCNQGILLKCLLVHFKKQAKLCIPYHRQQQKYRAYPRDLYIHNMYTSLDRITKKK